MKLAQADSVVNVNPVDISVLEKESKKNPMEKSENVFGQLAAPDMAKESDRKINENELDLDKKNKENLKMSQAKVFY